MENTERYRIPLEKLRKVCNLDKELDFCSSTREVAPFDGVIGQERAVRSMQFGLDMDTPGYNIFVVGPNGTGRSSYANAIVARTAVSGQEPDDWCYLNNFINEDQPWAVSLPPGGGRIFQKDMDELVKDLKVALPKAYEENTYVQRKTAIITTLQHNMEELYRAIDEEARTEGFTMRQIPPRFMFMPIKNGQPMPPEDFEKLTPQERQDLDERGRKLTKRLDETLRTGQTLEKEARTQMEELEKQVAYSSAGPLVGRLHDKYADFKRIVEYLDSALKDIVEKHDVFVMPETPEAKNPMMMQMPSGPETDPYIRYRVNVLVNNEKCSGQPVIIEPTPNYYNLFGKIEYNSQMFSMSTDFTMIRPGALHKANGGFLILQAKDILTDPYVWETLKKALKHGKAIVENIGEQYRLVPTGTIKPEPIPLNVKVIIISNPQIYDILYTLDEDFQKLFKVRVDFDIEMPRSLANICQYASFVSFICRRDNLKDFSRSGLGKVIEYGSRLAGNQNKLSTRFNDVTETIYEAAALAAYEGSELVEASHVSKAIEERKYRANRIEEKIQEQIIEKKMLISTEGMVVGQLNGLSVMETGGYAFGLPSRITARTYAGTGGVINIERETEMSGNIHSKGVLTLSGYLGGKFAQKKPLGMTAQITFEQSYGGVDGDSASSTELYAILSSLSGVPLKQSLAVTGSVNQRGEIQPIGGATEKIEGFFDICRSRGLSGEQGVIIPVQNIDNLMLKDEILTAVGEVKFHVYAVKSIEEGIEILSGVHAGTTDEDGKFEEGSVFHRAQKKLEEYGKAMEKLMPDFTMNLGNRPEI